MSEKEQDIDLMQVWQALIMVGRPLMAIDLPKAITKAKAALEMAPYLDPTWWMRKADTAEENIALMEAALPLWNHLKEMKQKKTGQL